MQNFVMHNPTKIIFGRDTIQQIGSEAAALGKKALLVYGKSSIKNNGIYEQTTSALKNEGIEIIEHAGVKSNPVISHVREGIRLAKTQKVDLIIAVGGGSVIDSAKAISAGATVDHDVWLFFKGKKSIKSKLPLACVLTLAAAGSEMNGGMVVTNEDTLEKFGIGNKLLHPEVSILDPTATFTVPADYTAFGAIDAIAHILEFYFTASDPETPVQDRIMEGLIINIMDSCERVLMQPEDYNARADLMWCATLALNGLTAAGLGRVGFPMHMIEHSLSAIYDVPHGAGLSIVMPGWMTHESTKNPQKFAQFGRRIFNIRKENEVEIAREGIKRLKEWFEKVAAPTSLSAIGVPKEDIDRIAENAMGLAKIWRLQEYNTDRVKDILQLCR
ncbi:MAG: iron-containing alcohol dehydrogenase [Proteobacteria bacterium]|nr:iron-containing alcohol dehydrogenase [Pseudomonadota bacterium]MBU1714561.1 iron-containing alcohol dehydrogenase [Pseudomonadota bacterium]